MAKEKQAVSDKKLAITKQIDKINLHKGSFREVNMADIVPSDFEPQVRRRAHFTDEEIEELKTSIEQNGLIEDIVVRPQGDKYQIVCGERRWLAIKKIGWKQIEVKVRELSDSAAIRVQMEENLQRKQLDPLEEAFSYKYLMDKANYSVRDLHIKFGRSERNIVQKLKLNDLSEEGKTLLAELKLPLGHAVEIAKYSPKQQADLLKKGAFKEIYLKNAESGKYEHINVPKSFTELKDHIRREVFRNLDIAPFSKSSTELHKEGLSCKNCPDHTGAKINQSLFDEGEIGKNDNCLNAKCFEGKMEAHIELKRKEIAEAANIAVETVPYITTEWKTKHKGLEPVRSYHYQEVDKKESCPSTVKGVFIDGKQIGLAILICQNKDCEIHGKGTTYSPKEQTPEEI